MIISDKFGLVFVHIPKCAGTTLRFALAPFDDAADRYYNKGVSEHPVLGPLDYHHIPLEVLAEHFTQDFDLFDSYRSFALVRDPFARFPSSLHERFVQRDGIPLSKRNRAEIAKEVDEVLRVLSEHPKDRPVTDPGLIHFSRQKDYIFLNGRRVVQTVRTVAEMDDVLSDLTGIIGRPIQPEESKNRRVHHVFPAIEKLQRAITRPIEKALPRRLWKPAFKPIQAAFVATGLMRHAGNPLVNLPNASEIDAFIAEFYAEDIQLFEMVNEARRKRAT